MATKIIKKVSKRSNVARKNSKPVSRTARKESSVPSRFTGFTHSLNWNGAAPSDLTRLDNVIHPLTHRVTFIYANPKTPPHSEETDLDVPAGSSPEDIAEHFVEEFSCTRVNVKQGAGVNSHRVEFDIPPGIAAIIHTIESRDWPAGASIPHNPPTISNRLTVLRGLTHPEETLEVWSESI